MTSVATKSNDTTQRDALARSICARICDERISFAALERWDAALRRQEQIVDLMPWLATQTYQVGDARDDIDRAYRQGWNDAIRHVRREADPATSSEAVLSALRELRDAEIQTAPRVLFEFDTFDLDEIGGES